VTAPTGTVAAPDVASVPLHTPRDGVPPVVASAAELTAVVEAFSAGTGPVAVDAERASGYRYGQRAYLIQLRRRGSGTALIDPIACPELATLNEVIRQDEWVLHAANQDLPCLAEVGLTPSTLFDTELAGRLAGHPRVGLGAMVESVLGLTLEKGHSAADWSRRPLPEPWLRYAALDVEVLIELRDALAAELGEQGKLAWAREEFAAIAATPPPAPRAEAWRRTSGIHRVRSRRQLAAVRALWETRDDIARNRDIAPGRVLPDAAVISAVLAKPRTAAELSRIPVFTGRSTRRHLDRWFAALASAGALPEEALPGAVAGGDAPPPAHRWAERDQVAAERLAASRAAVAAVAEPLGIPVENLLSPDAVRRLAWRPPDPVTIETVTDGLRERGARPWQVSLTAEVIAGALDRPPEDVATE
jgi:ribonuclease D